jgi:uncharacterized membrane protein
MRYRSIDLLRTVAIVLMVLVHFVENLSGITSYRWAPGNFAAPFFTFLVGVSYYLWLTAQESRGRADSEISKQTVRRGLFLFGLGIAFNIVVWLPEGTFNWDVLTAIGASLIALNIARKVPTAVLIVACVVGFVISPPLRAIAHYEEYWLNGYFESDLSMTEVSTGFLLTGYFPMLPWIFFPLVGYASATYVFADPSETSRPAKRLAVFGAVLTAAGSVMITVNGYAPAAQEQFFQGWTMFPATTPFVLTALGATFIAFSLLHLWLDTRAAATPESAFGRSIGAFSGTFSRHSLSIYVLHHVVHLWPLWIYGAMKTTDPTYFWRNAMPEGQSLLLALVFLVLSYLLFRGIDRAGK